MPKADQVLLRSKPNIDDAVDVIYQIEWPALVTETNGRWLYIKDDGGYTVSPNKRVRGWVRADDIVMLDQAQTKYARQLEDDNPKGVYYWLSGIYWESQGVSDVAIADYQQAEAERLGIDDVEIRLGRLLAASYFDALKAKRAVPGSDEENWEDHFTQAWKIQPRRPQLYLDWGVALCQAGQAAAAEGMPGGPPGAEPVAPPPVGKQTDDSMPAPARLAAFAVDPASEPASPNNTDRDAERDQHVKDLYGRALKSFAAARTLAPGWWAVPLAQAQCILDLCTITDDGIRKYDPRTEGLAMEIVKPYLSAPASPLPALSPAGRSSPGLSVAAATLTPGAAPVASATRSAFAVLWNKATGGTVRRFDGHTDRITSVAVWQDPKAKGALKVVTASRDGKVRLWIYPSPDGQQTANGDPQAVFSPCGAQISAVAFSSDGNQLLTGCQNGSVMRWNVEDPTKPVQTLKFPAHKRNVSAVAFAPDDKGMLTGSWDATAKLWDANGTCQTIYSGHSLPVTSVAMVRITAPAAPPAKPTDDNSKPAKPDTAAPGTKPDGPPGGKSLDSAAPSKPADKTADGNTDAAPPNQAAAAGGKAHNDGGAAGSKSGDSGGVVSQSYVLTGSYDYTARLWNTADGSLQANLTGHCGPISALAFGNKQGTSMLTGSFDQTARVWT